MRWDDATTIEPMLVGEDPFEDYSFATEARTRSERESTEYATFNL
jgi:hypothetical protein